MRKFFKKLLLLLSLLFFSNFLYAITLPENDWTQENIKAKVKSVKIERTVYNYENKEDKTKNIIHFNDRGFKVLEEFYFDDIVYKEIYIYDDKGFLDKISNGSAVIFYYKYKMDKAENLIQMKIKNEKSGDDFEEEIIVYDKNGKKIRKEIRYGKNKELIVKEAYIYDDRGRLKKIKDELYNNSIVNEYKDINENYIAYEMTTYFPVRKIRTYYDKNNYKIEELHFKKDDDMSQVESHFFYNNILDSHKNLLESKIYEVKSNTESKKIKIMEKRYYEYY